jgi:hypothetical protein
MQQLALPHTLDAQMTSRRCKFIHWSHSTMWPLYVSPVFSSTSCSTQALARARLNERTQRAQGLTALTRPSTGSCYASLPVSST